jgi:excisionase family DNA binding protein
MIDREQADSFEKGAARLLKPPEAARLLGMSARTLREHVKQGTIPFVAIGLGVVRRRRMFHPADLAGFIDAKRESESCLSIGRKTRQGSSRRRSTTTSSGSEALGFMAQRAARLGGRPLSSSGSGASQPPSK